MPRRVARARATGAVRLSGEFMTEASNREDAAPRPACRAWRAHGAVRRLRHADPISDGRARRAPAHAQVAPACSTSRIWARRCSRAGDHAAAARFSRRLCPADIVGLAPGRQRYTQLLNDDGGIIDDLMVARPPGADGASAARRQRRAQGRGFRPYPAELPPACGLTTLPSAR